jgi:hypothetical protein
MKTKIISVIAIILIGSILAYALMPIKKTIILWDAPTTNVDGTPLTDLMGYKVYCGNATGNYTIIKDVSDVTQYLLTNLFTTGVTYYCVITAYDSFGNESDYSNEVSFNYKLTKPKTPVNKGIQ